MYKILLLLFIWNNLFAMHHFKSYINNKNINIETNFDISQYNNDIELEKFYIGNRIFYFLENNINEELYYEVNSYLNFNSLINHNFNVQLGLKYNKISFISKIKQIDFSSIPLTFNINYKLNNILPITLKINSSLSPSILTFDDGKNFIELNPSLSINIINNLNFDIGYDILYFNCLEKNNNISINNYYFGFDLKF
jgi:hypothetical protein